MNNNDCDITGFVRSLRNRRVFEGHLCSLRYYDLDGAECFKEFISSVGVIEAKSGDEFELYVKSVGKYSEFNVLFFNKTVNLKYEYTYGEGFLFNLIFNFIPRLLFIVFLYITVSLLFSYMTNPSYIDYAASNGYNLRSVKTQDHTKKYLKCRYDIEYNYNPFSFLMVDKNRAVKACTNNFFNDVSIKK